MSTIGGSSSQSVDGEIRTDLKHADSPAIHPQYSDYEPSPTPQAVPRSTFSEMRLALQSSSSPSRYSNNESQYTDIAPPDEEDLDEENAESALALVKFVDSNSKILEEVPIRSRDDGCVEETASYYFSRGDFLMDNQLRSVHPSQCLDAALENDCREIAVVPRSHLQRWRQQMGLKRKASDDSNPRPRKFLMIPPQTRPKETRATSVSAVVLQRSSDIV